VGKLILDSFSFHLPFDNVKTKKESLLITLRLCSVLMLSVIKEADYEKD